MTALSRRARARASLLDQRQAERAADRDFLADCGVAFGHRVYPRALCQLRVAGRKRFGLGHARTLDLAAWLPILLVARLRWLGGRCGCRRWTARRAGLGQHLG